MRGWALAAQGRDRRGDRADAPGHRGVASPGASVVLATYLATLAEVCGQVGQLGDAQHLLREAQTLVDSTGERYWEAGGTDSRENCSCEPGEGRREKRKNAFIPLDMARRQQAKSLELRTAINLSRL